MRVPTSTYRLQLHAGFTLDNAVPILDDLVRLGVGWVYLSPILPAAPGSTHGYDVVGHSTIDRERGGPEAFERLVSAARARGLGVLVDIVPNHMGIAEPAANDWWWSVLREGRASPAAGAFDIDWEFGGGKVRLPILPSHTPASPASASPASASPELADWQLVEITPEPSPRFEIRNGTFRLPVAAGTAAIGDSVAAVHRRQHYELVEWQCEDYDLNYRRFFTVSTLAGLRVENSSVYHRSHVEIARWFTENLVDGLRIDHPDGLADPEGYLTALAATTGGSWVVVEKILDGDEVLPSAWAASGTTGYDALIDIDRVLVDPRAEPILNSAAVRAADDAPADWSGLVRARKRAVATGHARSEVNRLVRDLDGASGVSEFSTQQLTTAVVELLAAFPVYRSYLPGGAAHLAEAILEAQLSAPQERDVISAVGAVLGDPTQPAAVRFQQTSGTVMAKGVEDSSFYRWNRLVSLNEVGGSPRDFARTVPEFHRRQLTRLERMPQSMTTLSTHDTKRSEDVRSRISALSEIPEEWLETLAVLRSQAPTGDTEFDVALWQSAIGAWPIERDRLHGFAVKAAREAGTHTTWTVQNSEFEAGIAAAVDAAFESATVTSTITAMVSRLIAPGRSNSLTAKLLQLTTVGLPDVYQGTELWDLSLVDPDNRRRVDFANRREILARIDDGWLPPIDDSGAAKLLVVSRALRARREHPGWFDGYAPLTFSGVAANHAIGFSRAPAVPARTLTQGIGAITIGTRLPIGLVDRGGWDDTAVEVTFDTVDTLTGRSLDAGTHKLTTVLADYPVALLLPR